MDRPALMHIVAQSLKEQDWARGLWEGGSAAFGRADAWSDLDAVALVSEGAKELAFTAVEAALAQAGEVRLRHRVPEPAWHGHAQCFYQLAEAGPYRMIDLLVMEGEPDARFLVRERHGEPVVTFDKDDVVHAVPLDWAAQTDLLRRRVANLRTTFPLFLPLVEKELRRGRDVDAMAFYQGLCLRPLVELLRIRHCPERHDYGLRYLGTDLPPEIMDQVRRLAYAADPEALAERVDHAAALFERTLRELDADGQADVEADEGAATETDDAAERVAQE